MGTALVIIMLGFSALASVALVGLARPPVSLGAATCAVALNALLIYALLVAP